MRRLAFDERPLAQIDDLVNRLKVTGVERRIDTSEARPRADTDPEARMRKMYSERFNELIALERERRELRSED